MNRDRNENRRSGTRWPYNEHPDSRGPVEYLGSNKRHPGLSGGRRRTRREEDYPFFYQNGYYGDGEEDHDQDRAFQSSGELYIQHPHYHDAMIEYGYGAVNKGRESLRQGRQREHLNYARASRNNQVHGMNESENYGRRHEAALYDEISPERRQHLRGRGYMSRSQEGEYEQDIRENFGNRQGFGRHDDERDYSKLGYRNTSSGYNGRRNEDEYDDRPYRNSDGERRFSRRRKYHAYGSERYGDGGGYSQREQENRNRERNMQENEAW